MEIQPVNLTTSVPEEIQKPKDRSRWVFPYTTFFSISGFLLILIAFYNQPTDHVGLALFIIMGFVAELFSVELFTGSRGSRISVAAIIAVAGILTFGQMGAVLINMFCGIAASMAPILAHTRQPVKSQASWFQRVAFNIGMLVISISAAGWIYTWVSQLHFGLSEPFLSKIIPFVIAVSTNELVNLTILIGVLYLQTSQPPLSIWANNFSWAFPIGIAGGVIGGGGLAIAYSMFGPMGLAVFFLPVLSIGYSFRLYVNHTKEYVNKLEEMNRRLDNTNISLLETFGAIIDAYDIYTYGHSAQVAVYTGELAKILGMPEEERSLAIKAALIHDIGKIGIQDSILSKQGSLSEEEITIMRGHPIIGANIIRRMEGLQALVPLVRHHHEHWDGCGYPAGLAGEETPLIARIIGLADAIDAMSSERPYHPPKDIDTVRKEVMRCSGTQFDPEIVKAFLILVDQHGNEFFKNSALTVDNSVRATKTQPDQQLRYLKRSATINYKNG